MDTTITLSELFIGILFLLLTVAGGFAIVALRNFNRFISQARSALEKNQAYIDTMTPDLVEISRNSAQISKDLALGAQDVSETATVLHEAVGNMSGYAVGVKELLRIVADIILPEKDK